MKEIIERLRVAAGEADGAYAYPFAEIAKVDAAAILTALKAGQAAEKMYADLLPVAESQYKRVRVLTEAQRAARECLTLALNGECGISNGHLGEESCTKAQIAKALALLTVEPEAPDA